jgi:hypothetical protein
MVGLISLRRQHNFLYLGDVALRVDEVQVANVVAATIAEADASLLLRLLASREMNLHVKTGPTNKRVNYFMYQLRMRFLYHRLS